LQSFAAQHLDWASSSFWFWPFSSCWRGVISFTSGGGRIRRRSYYDGIAVLGFQKICIAMVSYCSGTKMYLHCIRQIMYYMPPYTSCLSCRFYAASQHKSVVMNHESLPIHILINNPPCSIILTLHIAPPLTHTLQCRIPFLRA